MSGWAAGVYTSIITGLRSKPGATTVKGRDGTSSVPVIRPTDLAVVLAAVHDDLIRCVTHLASPEIAYLDYRWYHASSPEGAAADSQGAAYKSPPTVSLETWVTLCQPLPGTNGLVRISPQIPSWIQQVIIDENNALPVGTKVTLPPIGLRYLVDSDQGPTLANVVDKSDQCYMLAAAILKSQVVNLTQAQVADWWDRVWQLLVALEVGLTTPTPGLAARILGGIQYATVGTAQWVAEDAVPAVSELAGQVLAGAGKAVGEGLGAGAKGFAATAGFTAWLVVIAAIVIWMEV